MRELQPRSVDFFGMPKQSRPPLTPEQIAQRKLRRREKAQAAQAAARDARRASQAAAREAGEVLERVVPIEWAPLMRAWS